MQRFTFEMASVVPAKAGIQDEFRTTDISFAKLSGFPPSRELTKRWLAARSSAVC